MIPHLLVERLEHGRRGEPFVPSPRPVYCRHCKSGRIVGEDFDGKPLAWEYRRDVLGVDWRAQPDLREALCYPCYLREVLQWAAEYVIGA